jgi:uncharacterized protein (TIGR00730 family)
MTTLRNICVYCGSSAGRTDIYAQAAKQLAQALVQRDIGLVYGGASVGIMGVVADEVLALGGRAIGVIPEPLVRWEVAHDHLTELHVTQSMHERKTKMAELSDGFIALPGGLGTLEEMFEICTWAQLGIHNKPCGLLNIDGYYDPLRTFLDHAVAEQFVKPKHREIIMIEEAPEQLIERFQRFDPPPLGRWVTEAQT